MATGKISKRAVEAVESSERDSYLWDSELAGFGVKVTPPGGRVYLVQYRIGGRKGRTRRVTIGRHGALTPDQARQEARRLLGEIATGRDPAAHRAQQRREPTMAELADRYLSEHVATHNKPKTGREVRRLVEKRINPALGRVRVAELTRAQVKGWHHGMRKTPYEANRALAYLSKMLTLATEDWELRPDNPCRGVKRFQERRRERFFTDEELRGIGATLAEAEQAPSELPGALNAIRLLAVTGCRLSEVLSLRWADVDLQAGAIRLQDAKAGARTVPLGAAALTLLASLERSSEYVVHGTDSAQPLTVNYMEKLWRRLRDRAGVPDSRLHDFRHTAGTYAAQAGFNAFMVRDLQGHKTMSMAGRYVERSADPLRAVADAVSGRVAAAINAEPDDGAEVVELPKRKV